MWMKNNNHDNVYGNVIVARHGKIWCSLFGECRIETMCVEQNWMYSLLSSIQSSLLKYNLQDKMGTTRQHRHIQNNGQL